ncbi:hypothetical protein [Pseudomonas sp. CJQ_11]|uniref:hypothetical protein n=1 Tax=Pseudomonas sp. CJQ_11 TaxID=3367169 RepID=UPI00370A96E0
MDTNKIGEQFEVAFVAKYGFGRLAASANADARAMYEAAKWAWQASREAVVVELCNLSAKANHIEDGICTGLIRYDDACSLIESYGLKVSP